MSWLALTVAPDRTHDPPATEGPRRRLGVVAVEIELDGQQAGRRSALELGRDPGFGFGEFHVLDDGLEGGPSAQRAGSLRVPQPEVHKRCVREVTCKYLCSGIVQQ